jgi:HK97 family phage prohead protease
MTVAPEQRLYATELRHTAGRANPYRTLEGRAVPFGQWASMGWFMESHAPGSLTKTTRSGAGQKLPLLLFHDHQSFPIGHAESWINTDDGLDGVWSLNDSDAAQAAAAMVDAGDLLGLSVGFLPIRSAWDYVDPDQWNPDLGADHMDHVTRLESRLVEVSLTPTPAFAAAQATLVRSAEARRERPERAADAWRREVDRLRSA